MVEIQIREDGRGRLSSFSASGHAGWADEGSDVICAAVSAVLQSAWLGLAEVVGVEPAGERDKGHLSLSWPEAARDDVGLRAIVATAALSLERIAQQYPGHLRAIRERADG